MQDAQHSRKPDGTPSPELEARTAGARLRSAWTLLRQAVQGTQQDYTEGSLNRAVFLLSVPMILEMVMESVFGVLDVYFVGRLGPDAVASVGLTESFLAIVFAVAIVFFAITIAEALLAVVGLVVFRRGAWKTQLV